ncbi:hypothetical protein T484DRAFT_1782075, partial [Baffinella frigidus]
MPAASKADTRKLNKVKKKRVEGWDMKLLARSIEACAVSLGVLQVVGGELQMMPSRLAENAAALNPQEMAAVRNQQNKVLRETLQRVLRQHPVLDVRGCAFCRIPGDLAVQGRMLFVEVGVWAHVQCLSWSRGVYEDILSRKLGKYGMLCRAHHAIREAASAVCDLCGTTGAAVACSAPGCATLCHFGCAVMGEYLFFAEGHAFCSGCREAGPLVDELGGKSQALGPAQMCKLAARHLRVMPRNQPRMENLEVFK